MKQVVDLVPGLVVTNEKTGQPWMLKKQKKKPGTREGLRQPPPSMNSSPRSSKSGSPGFVMQRSVGQEAEAEAEAEGHMMICRLRPASVGLSWC